MTQFDEQHIRFVLKQELTREQLEDVFNLILGEYGHELIGYFRARTFDVARSEDVYQQWCLRVWRYLGSFRGDSTIRTWLYCLARSCLRQYANTSHQNDSIDQNQLEQMPAKLLRTQTSLWRKTESKNKLWEVCKSLSDEEQELLLLRVMRRMSWADIAFIVNEDKDLDDETLKREAAALRKRYSRLKEHLKSLLA